MVTIKNREEVAIMRQAGRIVAMVHEAMRENAHPGISTAELDAIAEDIIRSNDAEPAFKGYPHRCKNDFPATICASINDEIVHGIPDSKRILKEGDIISIDVGALYKGFYGDAATTIAIGEVGDDVKRLMEATQDALMEGIKAAKGGGRLWNVIRAIQTHVVGAGFDVLREYQGHGIGRGLHEDPGIPNYLGPNGHRPKNYPLKPGMTIALEPMVVAGTWHTKVTGNGWTVVTADGALSAHYEHTIAITKGEAEILTVL